MKTSYRFAICVFSPLLLASIALGQQDYVGRYDVYTGYMYLNSPGLSLGENGFHTQIGMNPTKWYSMGFDFSAGAGDTSLTTGMMKSSVQQQISQQLAAFGLTLAAVNPVPEHSRSQTYATGPQFNYRHFKAITLFVHPDVGAIHETAIPNAAGLNLIDQMLIAQLAPSGTKQEWTCFYGVGGGIDFNVTRHVSLKVHADFVHDHLFSDLVNARNSVRLSVGPVFHMGKNVAEQK
jgi:hypothetical protein